MAQLSPSCLDNQKPLGPDQTLKRTSQCGDHTLKTAGSHLLNPCLPFHKPVLGKYLRWANRPRFLHPSPSIFSPSYYLVIMDLGSLAQRAAEGRIKDSFMKLP